MGHITNKNQVMTNVDKKYIAGFANAEDEDEDDDDCDFGC